MPGALAERQRPLAHCRNRSTVSWAVRATGTTFLAASTNDNSSILASRQQERISAPVQSVSTGIGCLESRLNLSRYSLQMACRSLAAGRSRKKIPSNRSARLNSGGSLEMSLAEHATNTSDSCSDSQLKSVPNNRDETPESPCPDTPLSAFSSSSISSTHPVSYTHLTLP